MWMVSQFNVLWEFIIYLWPGRIMSFDYQKSIITMMSHGYQGIPNHRRLHSVFNLLFRRTSNKLSNPTLQALCDGSPPVTGGFSLQTASNVENPMSRHCVSWWHWCRALIGESTVSETILKNQEQETITKIAWQENSIIFWLTIPYIDSYFLTVLAFYMHSLQRLVWLSVKQNLLISLIENTSVLEKNPLGIFQRHLVNHRTSEI